MGGTQSDLQDQITKGQASITSLNNNYSAINGQLTSLISNYPNSEKTNNYFTGLNTGEVPNITQSGENITNNTRWYSKPEVNKFLSGSTAGTINNGPYAPVSGSLNYAPLSGSTNYAPITGSTTYAPITGSANYAPMSGSTNYAPITGSANYVLSSNFTSYFKNSPSSTNPIMTASDVNPTLTTALTNSTTASSTATQALTNSLTAMDYAKTAVSNTTSINGFTTYFNNQPTTSNKIITQADAPTQSRVENYAAAWNDVGITFTNPFKNTPVVFVSSVAPNTGDGAACFIFSVTGVTNTGFRLKRGPTCSIACSVSWIAIGF